MAIRWEQIQNLSVTEAEINLLAGLTATALEINDIAGFTGTSADLNNLIGTDVALAAHEAAAFATAHPILGNSLDGLLIVDGTLTQAKLAFNVALDTDIAGLQVQINSVVSDTAVQQTQIDNLFGIVIPGQGSSISDAIDQTIAHIELITDAHDATAISYGNNYALPSNVIAATTTSLILPANIIKHFRAGESIRFQDDITPAEDVVLTTINYTTREITFPVTANGYTVLDNAIIWTLAENNAQEALDRSVRNIGETELVLNEGLLKGTLAPQTLSADRVWTFRDLDNIIGNPSMSGNALRYLRTNAGETDTEWIIISAAEITYDNSTSGLVAINIQTAIDEVDGNLDTHIADTSIHFTEASIDHLNILSIGTNTHANIDTHIADLTIHRVINDAGATATDLWSASKIQTELALLALVGHNHALDSLSDVNIAGKAAASILEWDGISSWVIGSKGEINTVSNLGAGNGVFNAKVGSDLQLKSIVAGTNITVTNTPTEVTINSTASGGSGGGTAITKNQVAHGFSVLEPIYHDGAQWLKAQANNAETLAEYVVSEVTDVDNFVANKFGEITVAAHGKTVGEHYFLSDSVAGGTQITEPTNFSSPVFYAEDINTIHVEVYRPAEVTEVIGDVIDFQTKILSASVSTTTTDIPDLKFNALEIGRAYRITLQASLLCDDIDAEEASSGYTNDGSTVCLSKYNYPGAIGTGVVQFATSGIFIAQATTLLATFTEASSALLLGDGTKDQTFATLEELKTHQVTTKWN